MPYAQLSDGTIYVYNSNWQWIRTVSDGAGGGEGRAEDAGFGATLESLAAKYHKHVETVAN
jgi:hypothetical protein